MLWTYEKRWPFDLAFPIFLPYFFLVWPYELEVGVWTSKYFLSYSSGWVPSTILLLNIKLIHFVMFQIDFILDFIWAVSSSKVQRKEIKALYTRKHNPKFGPENKKCRMMNYDSPLEPTAVSERYLNSLCLLIF